MGALRFQRARAGGTAARSARAGVVMVLGTLMLVAAPWSAAPARAANPQVKPTQLVASLQVKHQVYASPALDAKRLELVRAVRPLTGARTTLPVLADTTSDGLQWLWVRLPGRPNGHTGWITRRGTVVSTTHWHVLVDTAKRRVTVYHDGRAVRTVKAVVGKLSTPTPPGQFFVEEAIALPAGKAGGPFALALSARSDVLQEFDGGPGQTALHGLANLGGVPGSAVSHGCVRVPNAAIRWMIMRIGPGVPVTITA